MNQNDPNVVRVELVAQALGDSWKEFVLVGGCAAGLLITDKARPPVRATEDVDLIAEITSYVDYYASCERLTSLGFVQSGDITCRWRKGPLIVDVIPTEGRILGYTNRWYLPAIHSAVDILLPSGAKIRRITAPLFLATKLDAFHGRGGGRYNESHDIEDIVNVIDGRAELTDEVHGTNPEVREYLQEEAESLLLSDSFLESIAWHLHPDAASQARRETVIARLRRIAWM